MQNSAQGGRSPQGQHRGRPPGFWLEKVKGPPERGSGARSGTPPRQEPETLSGGDPAALHPLSRRWLRDSRLPPPRTLGSFGRDLRWDTAVHPGADSAGAWGLSRAV